MSQHGPCLGSASRAPPFGSVRFVGGKSLEGSLACLLAVFAVTMAVTRDAGLSVTIAAVATILELMPTDDMDNVILPIGVGLFATFLLT